MNAFAVDEAVNTKWQESKRGARHVQLLQPANDKDRRADAADMHSSFDYTSLVTLERRFLPFCSASSVMPCVVSVSLEFYQFVCYGEKETSSQHGIAITEYNSHYTLNASSITIHNSHFHHKSLRISVQNKSNMISRSPNPSFHTDQLPTQTHPRQYSKLSAVKIRTNRPNKLKQFHMQ